MRKRLILIAAGVSLGLLMIEALLQTGAAARACWKRYANGGMKQGNCTILCLGESTTDGQYPPYLQERLNARAGGATFKVIDKGRGGVGTDYILGNLTRWLDRYDPDIVVAMMGIGDSRKDLIVYEYGEQPWYAGSRTYKAARLIVYRIRNKIGEIRGRGDVQETPVMPDTRQVLEYIHAGDSYQGLGMFAQAEEMYRKALNVNPGSALAIVQLGKNYDEQRRYREAEQVFLSALAKAPRSEILNVSLASLYRKMGRYEDAGRITLKILEVARERAEKDDAVPGCTVRKHVLARTRESEYYGAKTQFSFRKLKEIAARRGLMLVCVQYPMRKLQPLKEMMGPCEGVSFVDNEKGFREGVAREGYDAYFIDRFAGDFGHCTYKGNRLLAENIADVILQNFKTHDTN